ncbi:MFS transporter [Candidatus Nitrosocosmicus sp. T]
MVSNKISPKNNRKNEMKKNQSITNNIASIQHQEKVPFSSWKVLVILSCIATMVMYAETMLIPAIPTLVNDFHINYGLSSWLLTAYLVSAAVMTPIAGKLSDIYGRKKVLLIIMAIYSTGIVVGAISNDIYLMIFGRAIQGIGMSMFPIAFGMVRDQFPLNKLSIAQGLITSMFAIGAVIGLSVGGIIIQNFGWRMTFITIIPISIILLVVIKKYINESTYCGYETQNLKSEIKIDNKQGEIKTKHQDLKRSEKVSKSQIDIKGSVLLAIFITSLLLEITLLQPDSYKHDVSPSGDAALTVLPIFVVSLVSLILFILVERRAMHPLMNFKIFLESKILFSSIIIMIVGLSMFMVFQTIPILVQTPKPIGFSGNPSDTGQIQLPFAIVLLIFGPTSGLIISRLGSLKPTILGSVLTTTGFTIIFLLHSSEILISVGLAIVSAGLSLAAVGAMNIILVATPREFSGVTIGMSSMLRIIGSSIGPALAAMHMQTNQSTITNTNGITQMLPSSLSFDLIFLTAVILSSISILISLLLMKKAKSQSEIIA